MTPSAATVLLARDFDTLFASATTTDPTVDPEATLAVQEVLYDMLSEAKIGLSFMEVAALLAEYEAEFEKVQRDFDALTEAFRPLALRVQAVLETMDRADALMAEFEEFTASLEDAKASEEWTPGAMAPMDDPFWDRDDCDMSDREMYYGAEDRALDRANSMPC